jgi:biotin carboxyl carrier protein
MASMSGGVRVSVAGAAAAAAHPEAVPAPIVVDRSDDGPTVDGVPAGAVLQRLDPERAVLRDGSGRQAPAHRLLLLRPAARGADAEPGVERREVVVDGWRVEVDVEPAARAALRDRARRGREAAGASGPTKVHAIIPGVVVAVSVAPGDAVTAGQQLLVVEAMKMQNELRAPRDGTIGEVAVGAGSTIEVGDLLLVLA